MVSFLKDLSRPGRSRRSLWIDSDQFSSISDLRKPDTGANTRAKSMPKAATTTEAAATATTTAIVKAKVVLRGKVVETLCLLALRGTADYSGASVCGWEAGREPFVGSSPPQWRGGS